MVGDTWTVNAGSARDLLLASLVPGGDDVTSIGVQACLRVGAWQGRALAADQGTLTHFGTFYLTHDNFYLGKPRPGFSPP